MDALNCLLTAVALPVWPNLHRQASSWRTFCVPACVPPITARCSRGTSL